MLRPLIGVLGGMGPLATVDFLHKVIAATPAERDQDHVPLLIHSVPQIPDRAMAIASGSDEPFRALLAGLRLLECSGVGLIVIPCNTAHAWFDRLAASTEIRLLHIAEAVRADIDRTPACAGNDRPHGDEWHRAGWFLSAPPRGARKVADRVVFMDKGEIVEDPLRDDFFGKPHSDRAQQFLSKILQH